MRVVAAMAAVLVGAVLIVAGTFKLVDASAWRAQAADMGAPAAVVPAVPWLEVVLGITLVVPVLRPWPAISAMALLAAFTVLVVRRLRDGSRPPCACFGPRSNRPLGQWHVARNVVLLGLAAVAALGG